MLILSDFCHEKMLLESPTILLILSDLHPDVVRITNFSNNYFMYLYASRVCANVEKLILFVKTRLVCYSTVTVNLKQEEIITTRSQPGSQPMA